MNEEIAVLPCNIKHIFHSGCIAKWLHKNDVCPRCKSEVINLSYNSDPEVTSPLP